MSTFLESEINTVVRIAIMYTSCSWYKNQLSRRQFSEYYKTYIYIKINFTDTWLYRVLVIQFLITTYRHCKRFQRDGAHCHTALVDNHISPADIRWPKSFTKRSSDPYRSFLGFCVKARRPMKTTDH